MHTSRAIEMMGRSYARSEGGALFNADLFQDLAKQGVVSRKELDARAPVGKKAEMHSLAKRGVRWWQHNRELASMDTQPRINVPWTSLQ
jgi:hypothetical protein